MRALISTLLVPSRKPGWISQASSPRNDADTLSTGAESCTPRGENAHKCSRGEWPKEWGSWTDSL